MGYNSVADIVGLSSFVKPWFPPKVAQLTTKFDPTAVLFKVIQGHRSWCQSKAHVRLPISH